MTHSRIPVSALVALTVALTVGVQCVPVSPHHGARRRALTTRLARGGAPRLDAPDASGHDGRQHDPEPASVADTTYRDATYRVDARWVPVDALSVTAPPTHDTPAGLTSPVTHFGTPPRMTRGALVVALAPTETRSGCCLAHATRGPPPA